MTIARSLLCVLLLIGSNLSAAPAPVALKVNTPFQFAPGYVKLTVTIEPDDRNREYCLTWDGPQAGQQCRQLEGADAAKTRYVDLKGLPAGSYGAVAQVGRNDGSTATSAQIGWEVLESVPN